MALFNMAELLARLPRHARLLGIDPGAKRIGLALSDVEQRVVSPYALIIRRRLKENASELSAIATREGVGGLVVGLALDEQRMSGAAAQAARDWAHALSDATGLPTALHDESLTTADAHEQLINAGIGRKRRAALVDRMAAAAILQSALDQAWREVGSAGTLPDQNLRRP